VSRRRWAGSLARFLLRDSAPSRAAARRADAPHPAAARTRRNALRMMRSASWPDRAVSRPSEPVAGRKITAQRVGTPRIVRGGPSGVKGAPSVASPRRWARAPTLDPGDLCDPSGPDGEGQAGGQAQKARGEPLWWAGTSRTNSIKLARGIEASLPARMSVS